MTTPIQNLKVALYAYQEYEDQDSDGIVMVAAVAYPDEAVRKRYEHTHPQFGEPKFLWDLDETTAFTMFPRLLVGFTGVPKKNLVHKAFFERIVFLSRRSYIKQSIDGYLAWLGTPIKGRENFLHIRNKQFMHEVEYLKKLDEVQRPLTSEEFRVLLGPPKRS